ncbi:glycosyltransferase family 9 protein, partial [bacterium]|nr:glycosyltransferase family 9 protein [bacterium]
APAADQTFRRAAPGALGEHLGRLLPLRHHPSGLDFRAWYLEEFPVGLGPVLHPFAMSRKVRSALHDLGVESPRGYTLLVPGATWPSKAWPPENWRRLARALADDGRGPVVMLPPPDGGDAYRAALARSGLPHGGCLPPLSLDDALAAVTHSGLVITVDGGLMHAAVALARPTVALLGPTDPDIWFPYGSFGPYRALCTRPRCHPCDLHECGDFVCLPALTPGQVMDAIAALHLASGEKP